MIEYVWVVYAEIRDRDYYEDWLVAAYVEKESAEQHARMANDAMGAAWDNWLSVRDKFLSSFVFDKAVRERTSWPDRAYYDFCEVPVVVHVDQYMDRFPVKG